jgi:4-amino-4-deoxy-L-arabinose transferase-like glycosyltransferase
VVVAIVAIVIIANKTLSPQYLLWLGGPMAALLLINGSDASEPESRMIWKLSGQLLAIAILTQLVYPTLYHGIEGRLGQTMLNAGTAVAALRNLALVLFGVEVVILAWRSLGVDRRNPDQPPEGSDQPRASVLAPEKRNRDPVERPSQKPPDELSVRLGPAAAFRVPPNDQEPMGQRLFEGGLIDRAVRFENWDESGCPGVRRPHPRK